MIFVSHIPDKKIFFYLFFEVTNITIEFFEQVKKKLYAYFTQRIIELFTQKNVV